jgi:glycosyltransferase involved in cell wall biosynthesis
MQHLPHVAIVGSAAGALLADALSAFERPGSPVTAAAALAPAAMAGPRALRICLISETVLTGVGRHVVDLVRALTARGHEVHLLHSLARVDHDLVAEIAAMPHVCCRGFAMRREPHGSDVAVLVELARYVRQHGPFDAIHGHSSKGGVYARLLALFSGASCLYTPHAFVTLGPTLPRARRWMYAMVERILAMVTDSVICASVEEQRHACELGIAAKRLRVISHGIEGFDTSQGASQRGKLGLPSDAVVIGFVGRMDQQKAPQRLVDAGLSLFAHHRNAHVVMVGDGPLRPELEARVRRSGFAKRFSWRGEESGRAWIPAFDILAMPSAYEGFSYTLMEALYAGVPVVCTPVGGVSGLVIDGQEGFVVPHADCAGLAERLARLVSDAQLRASMGRHARARGALFSIERMTGLVEAAYLSPGDLGASAADASIGT